MLQGFQNIWICIFLKFLRIYIEFTSLLVWKRKRKKDFYLRKGPWKKFSSREEAPGRRLKQGSGEGEHGEKQESGERNLGVALVGRGAA